MAYVRKTYDEYELVYDYGYGDGPEVLLTEESLTEIKKRKKEYWENAGIYCTIRKRRRKIGG